MLALTGYTTENRRSLGYRPGQRTTAASPQMRRGGMVQTKGAWGRGRGRLFNDGHGGIDDLQCHVICRITVSLRT